MGHPVNLRNLNFSKRPSFDSENFSEEFRFSVQEVPVAMTPEYLERLEHILNVDRRDGGSAGELVNRKLRMLVVKQSVEDSVGPVTHICSVPKE